MTDPASATLATTAAEATTVASDFFRGVDYHALMGALAGGTLFVTSARDLSHVRRLAYLLVSTVAGYYAAPELVERLPLQSIGLCAFLAGAVAVTVATQVIDRVKTFDVSSLFVKDGT